MIEVKKIQKKWSFLKDKTLFIACSGGVDSIVLTEIFKTFCKKVTLLHVNYNLRGKESIEDCVFVENYAKKNQIPFEIKNVNTKKVFKKGNLQDTAREIRYKWFDEKLHEKDSYLLLAHHQDDQIETFFQHLARKSGMLGLACMLEKQNNIMRPLLHYSKEEIYQFAKENKISWREDSSNQKNQYTRNKLRNQFLPFLRKNIPHLDDSVLTLISVFQENQKEIDDSVKNLVNKILKENIFTIQEWNNLTVDQKISILRSFGYSPNQLSEIEKLTKAQKGKFISSKIYRIIREENSFYFKRNLEEKRIPDLIIEEVKTLPKVFTKDEIYLDQDKIVGQLELKFWKFSDRIAPIGMQGTKLISDVITEEKVPNSQRNHVLVLKDDQQIHWCVGFKVGRVALADKSSKKILRVKLARLI